MKVLFAVNNENISEAIIKKYQKIYGELLEYKNVYYYNAIVKELQRSRDYDIVVINEELETFSSNDANKVDSFILTKLENIVAVFQEGGHRTIPILFITNSKRTEKDQMIPNLFNLGIYDMLIGKDRKITAICSLINKPRTENEARAYYGLGTMESPGIEAEIVSIKEINNILKYYKKLAGNKEEYNESFNKIIPQYDDEQLKYIIDRLPKDVRDVLEKENDKYNEIINKEISNKKNKKEDKKDKKQNNLSGIIIPKNLGKKKKEEETEGETGAEVAEVDEEVNESSEEAVIDNNEMQENIQENKKEELQPEDEVEILNEEENPQEEDAPYATLDDDVIVEDDSEDEKAKASEERKIERETKKTKAIKDNNNTEITSDVVIPEDIVIGAGKDEDEYVPIFSDVNEKNDEIIIPEFGGAELEKQDDLDEEIKIDEEAQKAESVEENKEEPTEIKIDAIDEEADMLSTNNEKIEEKVEDDEINIFGDNNYFNSKEDVDVDEEDLQEEKIDNKIENKYEDKKEGKVEAKEQIEEIDIAPDVDDDNVKEEKVAQKTSLLEKNNDNDLRIFNG